MGVFGMVRPLPSTPNASTLCSAFCSTGRTIRLRQYRKHDRDGTARRRRRQNVGRSGSYRQRRGGAFRPAAAYHTVKVWEQWAEVGERGCLPCTYWCRRLRRTSRRSRGISEFRACGWIFSQCVKLCIRGTISKLKKFRAWWRWCCP